MYKNAVYTVIILSFLKQPLTLDFQVKRHLLCVISIGDKDSVEAFLLRPHPHQGENSNIPEIEEIWKKGEQLKKKVYIHCFFHLICLSCRIFL